MRAVAVVATAAALSLSLATVAGAETRNSGSSSSSGSGAVSGDDGEVVAVAVEVVGTEGSGGVGVVSVPMATVHPVCWYSPGRTGQEMAAAIEDGDYDHRLMDGSTRSDTDAAFPGWESHKDDTAGRWYHARCSQAYFDGDDAAYQEYRESFEAREGNIVYREAGQEPPRASHSCSNCNKYLSGR